MNNKKIVLTIIGLSIMVALGAAGECQAYTGIPDDFLFTKNLSLGSRSTDVVYLKVILANEGCLFPSFTSNYFGLSTLAGAKCFCNKYKTEISEIVGYNVNCTGFVGTGVRAKLNNLLAVGPNVSPSPTPTTSPAPAEYVKVISPNGGEKLTAGSTYQIKIYCGSQISKLINISLKDSRSPYYKSILTGLTCRLGETSLYNWTISSGMTLGEGTFKIRVETQYTSITVPTPITIYDESMVILVLFLRFLTILPVVHPLAVLTKQVLGKV